MALAKPFYFAHHAGQMAVASSMEKVVRVGFSNSYRGSADDAPILRVVGYHGAHFFKQSFELKIKGDLISESAVESIIGELQEIFARHGAGAALSAKAVFKPTKDFHTARHTLFSADQNLEIDEGARITSKRQVSSSGKPDFLGKLSAIQKVTLQRAHRPGSFARFLTCRTDKFPGR